MNKINTDGIIFDLDGTVWDNTPIFAKAWTDACQKRGYDVVFTADRLKELFGQTMTDIADQSIPDESPERRYATLKACEEEEMLALYASPVDTFYPGLIDLIKGLSKRVNLYVVSNCQQGYIESFLERGNLEEYFTDFICYGDNGLGKADNIKLIVEKNNIKHPIYVGDIQKDKDACDQAGVDFVWASYGYDEKVDSYVAKIDSIGELNELIS
ncbi:MAG: HAD family hydrolase [Pseudobutyrivibrio sp.]|nr:HAD family hydrolase [Pseudobutyrivibrio sp.]